MGLYLVRHASTDYNVQKRCQGRSVDLPLNAQGIKEAELLRDFFECTDFKEIYCSPLERAFQTASIIAQNKNCVPKKLEAFIELDMGQLSGLQFSQHPELFRTFRDDFLKFYPPSGEDVISMSRRVIPAFQELCKKSLKYDSIIVTHLCVIKVLLTQFELQHQSQLSNGCVYYAWKESGRIKIEQLPLHIN